MTVIFNNFIVPRISLSSRARGWTQIIHSLLLSLRSSRQSFLFRASFCPAKGNDGGGKEVANARCKYPSNYAIRKNPTRRGSIAHRGKVRCCCCCCCFSFSLQRHLHLPHLSPPPRRAHVRLFFWYTRYVFILQLLRSRAWHTDVHHRWLTDMRVVQRKTKHGESYRRLVRECIYVGVPRVSLDVSGKIQTRIIIIKSLSYVSLLLTMNVFSYKTEFCFVYLIILLFESVWSFKRSFEILHVGRFKLLNIYK